jgi:hypothetical protein
MQVLDHDNIGMAEEDGRPRTLTVLTLLTLAAFVFSYLGAYALAGALVSAGVINGWAPDDDPRPRNMVLGFVALMVLFLVMAGGARLLSSRQLRRIDAMAEEGG